MKTSTSILPVLELSSFVYKDRLSDKYYERFFGYELKGYEIIKDVKFLRDEEPDMKEDPEYSSVDIFSKDIVFFGDDKVELGEVGFYEKFLDAFMRLNQVSKIKYICLSKSVHTEVRDGCEEEGLCDGEYRHLKIYELAE